MTDLEPVPPQQAATQPRHVHPITPLVQAFRLSPVIALGLLFAIGQQAAALGLWMIPAVLAGIVVIGLIIGLFSYLAWQRLWFYFDDSGDFRLDSGILTKQQRRLQLSRLQSVDISQPLVARLVGLATVRIEVAGAGDSRASIEFLTLEQAEALRAEVLARAAGIRPDTPAAPEQAVLSVDTRQLVTSLLLRGSTISTLLLTVAGLVAIIAVAGPAGLLGVVFVIGVPALAVFSEFSSFYGFTVAKSPDGLRTRAGLLQTRAQTIPPGRVHAVEFTQSILWRRRDWVRVSLNIAGVQQSDDNGQNGNLLQQVLVPVATTEQAQALVREIMPELDIASVPLTPAPAQASKRAWIQHDYLAYGSDENVIVTRRGRFVRRIAAMPHARVQSVRVTAGPWQKRLGLATVHADSVPGPVHVAALYRASAEAREIAEREIARMHAATARSGPDRWMTRRPDPAAPPTGAPIDLPPPTGEPANLPPPEVSGE